MHPDVAPLPRRWRMLFLVEVPIVAATVLYWMLSPDAFLTQTFGIADPSDGARGLLYSYAGVTATTVMWFYARLLLAPAVHVPTFRRYQEALLLGDVWIVVAWGAALVAGGTPRGPALAGIGMATLWGTIRSIYLVRTQAAAPDPT